MLQCPGSLLCDKSGRSAPPHVFVFVAAVAIACDGRNDTGHGIDTPDTVVHCVRDIHVVLVIEYHAFGCMEHCLRRWFVVTIEPIPADSSDRGDDPARMIDLTDSIAALVDRIDIALTVDRNANDVVESCFQSRLAVVQI